ncbi:MAG TPA: dihydroneopterin aldolase [Phycisphaerales bacterium]|nr:dihydroneopterin aldolase [Phycisphaerales bacterium]
MTEPCDTICIQDLRFRCVIGTNEDERRDKQDVIVNITLFADLRRAAASDRLDDTINYKTVKKAILAMGEASRFQLIETLAERIADLCLDQPLVERVQVRVDKPGALRFARSVAVQIERSRSESS